MPDKSKPTHTRRALLAVAAAMPASLIFVGRSAAATQNATPPDDFKYEVVRTEAEWHARLSEQEYHILRQGGTEPRQSSLNAFEMRGGTYRCRGCDLTNFDSKWKVPHFDIGWAFFRQARPNTILTSIDETYDGANGKTQSVIECHCRRCGSHSGHILNVRGEVLHCLNGASLVFSEA